MRARGGWRGERGSTKRLRGWKELRERATLVSPSRSRGTASNGFYATVERAWKAIVLLSREVNRAVQGGTGERQSVISNSPG